MFSRKTWDTPVEGRPGIAHQVRRARRRLEERVLWTKYEKEAIDKAKAAGIQVIEISDKKPFQDAVKPVWDKYGPKFAELIKRIQAVQ